MVRMRFQFVHALADFRKLVWQKIRTNIAVKWLPGLAGVSRAKCAGCRNPYNQMTIPQALDGMHHHTARARGPFLARRMMAEAIHHFPVCAIISAAEKHSGISADVDSSRLV